MGRLNTRMKLPNDFLLCLVDQVETPPLSELLIAILKFFVKTEEDL